LTTKTKINSNPTKSERTSTAGKEKAKRFLFGQQEKEVTLILLFCL